MPYAVPVKLSQAFCSYCGRPPRYTLQRTSRVCTACKLGMILRAPTGKAPRPRDPFLVIDDRLNVQAISKRAELVLGIAEPDSVVAPIDRFLRPANGTLDRMDLALLLELAVAGIPRPDTLELKSAMQPQGRFRARLTSCGQPRAALLVLAPLPDAVDSTSNGKDPESNGTGSARNAAKAVLASN